MTKTVMALASLLLTWGACASTGPVGESEVDPGSNRIALLNCVRASISAAASPEEQEELIQACAAGHLRHVQKEGAPQTVQNSMIALPRCVKVAVSAAASYVEREELIEACVKGYLRVTEDLGEASRNSRWGDGQVSRKL